MQNYNFKINNKRIFKNINLNNNNQFLINNNNNKIQKKTNF